MKNEDKVNQTAIGGNNIKQVGGNNKETNGNIFIGIFFVIILALGGLAFALTIGFNQGGQTPKTEQKSQTP